MNRKIISIIISSIPIIFITGCNGGGSNGNSENQITVVDGYVKNATVTDNTGLVGTYTSNGKYIFSSSPIYPISSTGGQLEDTNLSFDINMSVSDGVTKVISPITTFLSNDSDLLSKFSALGLGKSTLDEFSIDYVSSNDADLAKLSQVLYVILKDSTLITTFTNTIKSNSASSLGDIFTLASTDINASNAFTSQEKIRISNMLTAVQNFSGNTSNLETTINAYKSNLITESTTVITHNGITYGTLVSPHTGKTWLDRNIGASQTCTSMTDTNCYGDYYQWGRNTDGHEKSTSSTSITQATDINNAGNSFITSVSSYQDWTSTDSNLTQRAANWATIDGSSVCPVGYKVPTEIEVKAETSDLTGIYTVSNTTDLFNGFLSFPAAGYRTKNAGNISGIGTIISIATTSLGISSDSIKTFDTSGNSAAIYVNAGRNSDILYGITVRCIKAD